MTRRVSQLVVEMLDRVSAPAKRIGRSMGGMNRRINDAATALVQTLRAGGLR